MVPSPYRIRDTRKAKKMSGTEVAGMLGISAQFYYDIERGKKGLSADNALKLSHIFGVSVDQLLGTADANPYNPLHPKEERDIAADLERMINDLESEDALAFHGEPMDNETKELMRISLENSLRLAKGIAKNKFNPKKNQ